MVKHPLPNQIIWFITNHLGGWITLGCIVVGAIVVLSIVFREWIRDTFGAALKWLDIFVNRSSG